MEAFGIFGFMIGLVTMILASLAFSQVAGVRAEVAQLRAEVAQLRAELHRTRAASAAPGTLGDPNSLLSLDLRRDSWLGT